jgi:hypothetical protein
MASTPTQQRNAVSEGIALGLLVCGHDFLTLDKVGIDLAFEGAWRSWAYRPEFPQVDTDLSKGLDATWAITRAGRSKHVWVLYWEQHGSEFRICARQSDWSRDNPDDLSFACEMIDGDVPLTGWQELAREFLERFERQGAPGS